jgi:hypothetical protein
MPLVVILSSYYLLTCSSVSLFLSCSLSLCPSLSLLYSPFIFLFLYIPRLFIHVCLYLVFYLDGLSFLPDALLHLVISFIPHSYDYLDFVSKRLNRVVHHYNQFPRSLICGYPFFRISPYELTIPHESNFPNCLQDEITLHGRYFICSLPLARLYWQ